MSSSVPRQRALPSVDALLSRVASTPLPRPLVVTEIREMLQAWRHDTRPVPPHDVLLEELRARLGALERTRLQPVINGTGILAHTNLGRAPLASAAADALHRVAQGYCNLELDLDSGARGLRGAYLERLLALLCQAPAATVVNNGAAALILALRALLRPGRTEVLLSRGELVQIGGGFRIPEILETAGATLREVGTTNQTSLRDFESAVGPATALVLRVHRSNFHMEGFVDSPATRELAALAHAHDLPLVEDLGSGAMSRLQDWNAELHHEPTPAESLAAGADLVCFSGDKLMGGPQAGIVVGRTDLVLALRRHPLFRALRCDKLTFAALQATAEAHLTHAPQGAQPPMLELLRLPASELRARAEHLRAQLATRSPALSVEIVTSRAEVGGGVCPRSTLASVALALRPAQGSLESLAQRLRHGTPPVIGYLQDGRLRLDLRTILPEQDAAVLGAVAAAAGTADSPP